MDRFSLLIGVSSFVLVSGAGDADAENTANGEEVLWSAHVDDEETPRSILMFADPVPNQGVLVEGRAVPSFSKILFVNRCKGGCVLSPGINDARANTTMLAGEVTVVDEFRWSDDVWDQTMECIRDVYSPYDVQIVEEDPGQDIFHHEAILAGVPGDFAIMDSVLGVAFSTCSPLNNVISFSFANSDTFENDPLRMCATVAQESAHSFGLPNHVFNCLDPMTYLQGCGKKYFRNQYYPCGETQPGACLCGGTGQNSHQELLNLFGANATQVPPPTIEILFPTADSVVSNNFAFFWTASDPRLVVRNEIWVNGAKVSEISGNDFANQQPDYDLQMPDLADGYLDIEIRSENDLGSVNTESVTVLKGVPCETDDQCLEFQACDDGRCHYSTESRMLTEDCNVTEECREGICSTVSDSRRCSSVCDPSLSGSCDEENLCVSDNDGNYVCRNPSETGGCCSVAGTKHDPFPWFGASVFIVGLLLLRRRR